MDVRKPLRFKEIKFLYDSLKSDIKDLNDKIDFISEEVKNTIKNLSDEDRKKLEKGEYIENINKYGRIINKAYLEKREILENKDRFADPHTEFLKQKNQDLTAFKKEMPEALKKLEGLTEQEWNEKPDIDKIETEKYIRNQSYFVAEAMLPAINATKYEKRQNGRLEIREHRYNIKVYAEKDNAMVNFLVKLAEANEMLEPQEKHFAGVDEDKALSTLNMSVHFGNDKNLENNFRQANKILGREEYPTKVNEIQKEFEYDLPHFIKDKGLISHQDRNNLQKYIIDFISKVLKGTKDENGKSHYEVDKENLKLYINFLHQDLTDREILHIVNEINYKNNAQIFGKDRIIEIDDILYEREISKEPNITKRRVNYVKELMKNTQEEDREKLIQKLQNMFFKRREISDNNQTIIYLDMLKEYKNILTQAGIELEEIEKCSRKLEEIEQVLQKDNIHLWKNAKELFIIDKVVEILKKEYGFSKQIERMELVDLSTEELNKRLIDREGRFNKTNFERICLWGKKDCIKRAITIANSKNIKVKKYMKEDYGQR